MDYLWKEADIIFIDLSSVKLQYFVEREHCDCYELWIFPAEIDSLSCSKMIDEGEDVQADSPPKFVEEIDVNELQVIQVNYY